MCEGAFDRSSGATSMRFGPAAAPVPARNTATTKEPMVKRLTKPICLAAVVAAFLLPGLLWNLRPLSACDVSDPVVEILSFWPRDEYLLVYFQEKGRGTSDTAYPLADTVRDYGKRVNVKLVPVSVKPEGSGQPPATLLSPRGRVLACFESPPEAPETEALFESPARSRLVQALKEQDGVFLCLVDPKSDAGKQAVKAVKEALKLARDLTEFRTELLVIDARDPRERYLVKNLLPDVEGPEAISKQPAVALVCAHGRVADLTRGVPSDEQIIDRLQRIYRFGGVLGPSQFGEDLLLVW